MNRYIKAMEIGLAKEVSGIEYFDLFYETVGAKERTLSKEAESSFFRWFLDNFNNPDNMFTKRDYDMLIEQFRHWVYADVNEGKYHRFELLPVKLKDILFGRWFLEGQAAKQYLDYLELSESRKAATQARKQSNYSIWIAIGAVVISTLLGLASIFKSPEIPKPPYDVKVVEDKTRTLELEKENENLKEELYKAQMLIEIYESETTTTKKSRV